MGSGGFARSRFWRNARLGGGFRFRSNLCGGYAHAQWTLIFVTVGFPIQTVVFSGRADDKVLSIFRHAIVIPIALGEVFPLRDGVGAAGFYGGEFILADAAILNLFHAALGVKKPFAVFLNHRNRRGPFKVAKGYSICGGVYLLQLGIFLRGGREIVQIVFVFDGISGKQIGCSPNRRFFPALYGFRL